MDVLVFTSISVNQTAVFIACIKAEDCHYCCAVLTNFW